MSSAYAAGDPRDPRDVDLYPGQRLGLPEAGSGSLASWRQRILALFIDWAAASLLAIGVVGYDNTGFWPLVIYFAEASILTATIGGSFGQSIVRIGVISVDRRPLNLIASLVRHLLICLVIPAVIWDRDRRGLQDLAVRSVVVRR
ncbi:RDD family protein [Nocardioidaceae bacterium]|nr:RDD family protein [Nocardioidaceae bacterium]